MNKVVETILERKSVRAYEDKPVPGEVKDLIFESAMRAPTAGNMMLYSIIDVTDQSAKDTLAKTCDNQPFIAKAPLALLFLADYQRWFDYFKASGVEELCKEKNEPMRKPEEGDLLLACSDALIAAHSAVIAAESMGLGSCYIGDIMENYEAHRELFDLPQYVFPIAMVCFGYPTGQQKDREKPDRFDREYIIFENKYKRLEKDDFANMYRRMTDRMFKGVQYQDPPRNVGELMYLRKFSADFSREMTRSVREILKNWR